MLGSDPALFAQMICLNYRRWDGAADPEQEGLAPEKRQVLARSAGQLLSSWKSPLPGDGPAGLDEEALNTWVAEARRLCAEAGRAEVGDQKIGELLARGAVDPTDGAWPLGAVRQVLGSARSEHLDTEFCIGVHNGRGVTSRGLRDGGAQERAEADQYEAWAKAIRPSAPHPARLLVRIFDDDRAQAKHHDDDADRNDLL
jgi:hypothetical protein